MLLHEIARPVEDAEGEKSRRRLQGLLADSTGTVRTILKRLKMDNRSSDNICRLIYYLGMTLDDDPRSVRKAVRKVGKELFEDLLKVLEADLLAQGSRFPGKGPENGNDGIEKLNRIREIYNDIIATGQCTSLKELAVNGTDLLELGISRGKETGPVLEKLLDAVLEDPELNSRDRLLELARRFAGDHCQHN